MSMTNTIYDIFEGKIPIHTYTVNCKVSIPVSLPPYAGSVLRGVLGHGLRRLRINDTIAQSMSDREKYRLCPYRMVFEPPPLDNPIYGVRDIPVPYVITPPVSKKRLYHTDETLSFQITLIGYAIHKLPYIIHAFNTVMQQGIGKKNPQNTIGKAYIQNVYTQHNQLIWDYKNPSVLPHDSYAPTPQYTDTITSVKINLVTPLRLQQQGTLITNPHHITPKIFLMACVRRVYALLNIHTDTVCTTDFEYFKHLTQNISIAHDIRFHNWTRYSNRQQQKMDLGGWVGTITLEGNITPFMPYIYLCQYVHIGKNTSFGLGKLEIQ